MKIHTLLLASLFCFILGSASAQEKNVEADTINNTIDADTGRIPEMLNSKTFEFIANTVFPMGGTPKNLVGSGYSVSFTPEMIISNLPFYGRAYTGMTMGRDKGMRFEGAPENFTISDGSDYDINVTVEGESDTYSISMSVSVSGYATLSISSNDRGTITYQGEVVSEQ
ncbi:MAG: DUF4251 domain-containing protein [Aequorivita sp.]